MHSFARVFCGHKTSSWHGTTVQVAQPLPSLSLPNNTLSITTCHKYSVSGPISQGMSSHDDHVTDPLADTSLDVHSRDPLADTSLGVHSHSSLTDTSLGVYSQPPH